MQLSLPNAQSATSMELQLSDSDSEPNNDVLQLDLLQLRMALGKATQKERTERPSEQGSEPGMAAETFAAQQDVNGSHRAASGFPEYAQQKSMKHLMAQRDAMQSALDANRALQEHLEMVRDQIDKFMQDNAKHIATITQLRVNPSAGQGECPERLGSSAVGPSRFWVQGNEVPEQNADAHALLPYYNYLPHRFDHPQLWSTKNCCELQEQVLLVVKDEKTETLIEESRGDMTAMLKNVHCMNFQSPGTHEIIRGWSDDFWQERISPINGRTGKANRIHWHNHCSPTINDAEWSPEEETELLEIAQQHYHRNWEAVAEELGTGRTAMACLLQVKRRDQRTKGKGPFTEEEQHRIREGVSLYGQNWTEIASHVGGGRDRQQVMHHYKNVMNVTRKGRWLPEEDRQLSQAVSIVGERKLNRWSSVAERVYGRSQTQCRERWCNVLDPTLKTGTPWTKAEVAVLKEVACQHQKPDGSIKWAAVASHLPGRTDSETARQYWRIHGMEQKEKQKRMKVEGMTGPGSLLPGDGTAAPSQHGGAQSLQQQEREQSSMQQHEGAQSSVQQQEAAQSKVQQQEAAQSVVQQQERAQPEVQQQEGAGDDKQQQIHTSV